MQNFLMTVFKTIRIILSTCSFFAVIINILYLAYLFRGRFQGKRLNEYVGNFLSKHLGIVLCECILVSGILFSPSVFSHFENTNIGSFLEKESYSESYYVYIRPKKEQVKSYKIKADIIKGNYGYPTYTDTGEESYVIKGNGYFISKAYWPNGGYLTFLDDDLMSGMDCARIYPGKETEVEDYNGDTYYITLTTEKVK